jgi:hypothetical protein
MNREGLRLLFPNASQAFLDANAQPEAPARPKRRPLEAILTEMSAQLPPPKRGDVKGSFFPIPIISEANTREHWRPKAKRVAAQRARIRNVLAELSRHPKPTRVDLCRIGKRPLDSDNLANAFKHVRDEIASLLHFDDRDKSVSWNYRQTPLYERYGIEGFEVTIEWKPVPLCPHCRQPLPITPEAVPTG